MVSKAYHDQPSLSHSVTALTLISNLNPHTRAEATTAAKLALSIGDPVSAFDREHALAKEWTLVMEMNECANTRYIHIHTHIHTYTHALLPAH